MPDNIQAGVCTGNQPTPAARKAIPAKIKGIGKMRHLLAGRMIPTNTYLKKMKTVFKWIAGLLIAAGAVWIAMPFAFMYPFLYVKYSLNPDMTPATMEKIIKEKPKDIYEIEQRLNRKRILPGRNDSDFQSYRERLERATARYAAEGKLTSLPVNWYCGNTQVAEVTYIAGYETRTAWGRTKANLGDLSDKTTYYFLLDGNLRLLGWMKEESDE